MSAMRGVSRVLVIASLVILLITGGMPVSADAPIAWQQTNGPHGGSVETLVIRPDNPNEILIGAPNGMYRSTDGGLSWRHLAQEPIACQPIRVMAVAPAQPQTIYAGGDYGLFRTTDGGDSWTQIGNGLTGDYVSSLVVHPAHAEMLYAGVDNALFKSSDGGDHWTLANSGLPSNGIWSLAIHPSDPNLVYAGAEDGIYVTADGGKNWYPTGREIVQDERAGAIAIAPHDPLRLYAGTPMGLFRSVDGGANWQSIELPAEILAGLPNDANRIRSVVVDPHTSGVVYVNVAGRIILKSEDDGDNWSVLASVASDQPIHVLAIHPQDSQQLFLGTRQGFFKSLDGGLMWVNSSEGILASEIRQIIDIPKSKGRLYAATSLGIFRTEDQGKHWVEINQGLRDLNILALAVDPGDPRHLFALAQQGDIYRSIDEGDNWTLTHQAAFPGVIFDNLVVCRPHEQKESIPIVYLGASGQAGVWQSSDLGKSWTLQKQGLPDDPQMSAIALVRADPAFLYAGVGRGVYRLPVQPNFKGDLLWQRVSTHPLKGRVISISADPGKTGLIYVATETGDIYRGRNDGSRWELLASDALPTNLIVETLTFLPRRGRTPLLCATTNGGMFSSLDNGKTWALNSVGCLQRASVRCLATDDQVPGVLYGGTAKGGVYRGYDTTPRLTPVILYGLVALGIIALAAAVWFARRYLRKRRLAQNDLFERNWEQWNQIIAAQLAVKEHVGLQSLTAIPPQARVLAMRRYIDTHRDQDLVFREETTAIEPANTLKLQHLAENWLSLINRLENVESAKPVAARITEQVCELLGFSPIEYRTFHSLFGYLVKAPTVRLSIPLNFPIIFMLKRDLTIEDVRGVRDLMSVLNVTSFFALLVVVDDALDLRERAKELKRLVRSGADDFIVLDYQDLRSLFLSKDAERQLISIILTQVDLTVVSPYVLSGPVPENMFFGRDYELKAILRTIRERSFAIVGGRKIGKTSVLNKVHRLIEQTSGLFSIHLDCQYVTNYQEFFDAFAQNAQITIEAAAPDMLRRAMVRLRRQRGGNMIVLLLDEVDQLLAYDSQQQMRLFLVFRALSQEGLCRFVFCGERQLNKVLHDPASPLFNFCNTICLSYLAPRDAQRMIQEPMLAMGVIFEDEETILNRIIELSSCHPNLVQYICQMVLVRINERGERTLRLDDVEAVRNSGEFRDFFLEVTWGNATTLERLITVLMANTPNFTNADVRQALQQHGCQASNTAIEGALDGLMLFSILQRQGNTYTFAAQAFPAVLRESGLDREFIDGLIERFGNENRAD